MSDEAGTCTVRRWSELHQDQVLPGIARRTVHGERETVVQYLYAPGSVFPVHSHPEEQVTLVIRGTIAFDVGGRRTLLQAGDIAVIPGNVPHGAEVVGNGEVETYNVLAPRRNQGPTPQQR